MNGSEELETEPGTGPARHVGRRTSRSEHRGDIAIDLDAVEGVFLHAARQKERRQHQKSERHKKRFHVASSCGHHNQDVKQRKPFPTCGTKKKSHFQYADFTGIILQD